VSTISYEARSPEEQVPLQSGAIEVARMLPSTCQRRRSVEGLSRSRWDDVDELPPRFGKASTP